jgi:hypothetical protein
MFLERIEPSLRSSVRDEEVNSSQLLKIGFSSAT